jgi:type VI protein secretion system component VasK
MSLHPRAKLFFQACTMVFVLLLLVLLYKPAFEFVELAARELRYFWWLILLVLLAIWLIWGLGRKPKP